MRENLSGVLSAGIAAALILSSTVRTPASAPLAGSSSVTATPTADTTYTQIPQDGDNSEKTTLATCPQSCEGNASAGVTGDGTVAFALQQTGDTSRVYWASRENATTANRPRLTITYDSAPVPWRLVWSDEFNGTSLDTSKWNARNNTYLSIDKACITNRPQNVFVANGTLTLRAQRETYNCWVTRAYTDGYLATDGGLASFTYGRFEVRAKSPTGSANSKGLWPAFWMRPDDGGNGEIDVVELPGGTGYYAAATQAIFHDYTPTKQDRRTPFPSGDPSGFHTYTTEWEPGVLRWYIDGVQVWQRDRTTTAWFDEVFTKPYHLRLNFQTGGWLGDPDATTAFPADFQVDYVRVWQH